MHLFVLAGAFPEIIVLLEPQGWQYSLNVLYTQVFPEYDKVTT